MAPDLWSQLSGAMDAAEEMESSRANRLYSAGECKVDKFSSSHVIAGQFKKSNCLFHCRVIHSELWPLQNMLHIASQKKTENEF